MIKKLGSTSCTKCNINPRRTPAQRYCRSCHAEYQRMHRRSYKDFTPEQKQKADARNTAAVYLKKGAIQRQKICTHCSSLADEMHHEDYSKPLDVIWLCRPCHVEIHREVLAQS